MIVTHEMQQALASGTVAPRWMIWISAKDIATKRTEARGFWTGADEREFTIDGENRTYTAAGSLIGIGSLTYAAGLTVQTQDLILSMLNDDVDAAISRYSLRLAPVAIDLALLDPESEQLIGTAPAFRGWVENATISETAGENSTRTLNLTLVSAARAGTKTLPQKKSSFSQKLRNSRDRGRDYSDITTEVDVEWKK